MSFVRHIYLFRVVLFCLTYHRIIAGFRSIVGFRRIVGFRVLVLFGRRSRRFSQNQFRNVVLFPLQVVRQHAQTADSLQNFHNHRTVGILQIDFVMHIFVLNQGGQFFDDVVTLYAVVVPSVDDNRKRFRWAIQEVLIEESS